LLNTIIRGLLLINTLKDLEKHNLLRILFKLIHLHSFIPTGCIVLMHFKTTRFPKIHKSAYFHVNTFRSMAENALLFFSLIMIYFLNLLLYEASICASNEKIPLMLKSIHQPRDSS
jgi:hypothetical protein